ncbi:MAG: hypothetical protein II816_05280 [Elusimicrobia bacterium]|nr:hypothetical protein [Elusimicrobiota bacterium]
MNKENIIFLGIIDNSREFYSIFKEEANQDIIMVCEDVKFYKNIITITEEEIKKYLGDYKNIEELRKRAIKYFADNIQGKPVDIGEYKNIRISRKSRDKYESFSADERKLLIIPKLLEILKTSEYKKSESPYKQRNDEIQKIHYFVNEIIVKDNKYSVYITIGEDQRGKLFYDLDKNKRP